MFQHPPRIWGTKHKLGSVMIALYYTIMFEMVFLMYSACTVFSCTHSTHLHSDKDLSTAKEREASLHEDRASLELQWRHRCLEYKGLLETISTKSKEKDRELK